MTEVGQKYDRASLVLITTSRKCVIPVVCVKLGKGMYSNTT